MIHDRQQLEGWGKGVIPRLANDLKNELSEEKGFTERNLKFMVQFYKEYSDLSIGKPIVSQLRDQTIHRKNSGELQKVKPPVSQLQNTGIQNNLFIMTGWAHHIILIQKVKDLPTRYWYMQQCLANGWSRNTLADMIISKLHERQGNAATNFDLTLPWHLN